MSCGVTKNSFQERSVENYNFTLRFAYNDGLPRNNNSSDDEKETEPRLTNKRTNSDRYNVKLRLGKRRSSTDVQKGCARIIADLSTTAESTDDDVATDITTKLNERKDLLISKYFFTSLVYLDNVFWIRQYNNF